jgi:hypothetical protein
LSAAKAVKRANHLNMNLLNQQIMGQAASITIADGEQTVLLFITIRYFIDNVTNEILSPQGSQRFAGERNRALFLRLLLDLRIPARTFRHVLTEIPRDDNPVSGRIRRVSCR